MRQADAQGEAPLAGRLGGQRLLGHGHRVTRVGGHHGRAQFDSTRLASDQPQQADRVVRKRVGQPGRVQAGRLGPLRPLDNLVHRRALSGSFTDHHTDTHAVFLLRLWVTVLVYTSNDATKQPRRRVALKYSNGWVAAP